MSEWSDNSSIKHVSWIENSVLWALFACSTKKVVVVISTRRDEKRVGRIELLTESDHHQTWFHALSQSWPGSRFEEVFFDAKPTKIQIRLDFFGHKSHRRALQWQIFPTCDEAALYECIERSAFLMDLRKEPQKIRLLFKHCLLLKKWRPP